MAGRVAVLPDDSSCRGSAIRCAACRGRQHVWTGSSFWRVRDHQRQWLPGPSTVSPAPAPIAAISRTESKAWQHPHKDRRAEMLCSPDYYLCGRRSSRRQPGRADPSAFGQPRRRQHSSLIVQRRANIHIQLTLGSRRPRHHIHGDPSRPPTRSPANWPIADRRYHCRQGGRCRFHFYHHLRRDRLAERADHHGFVHGAVRAPYRRRQRRTIVVMAPP